MTAPFRFFDSAKRFLVSFIVYPIEHHYKGWAALIVLAAMAPAFGAEEKSDRPNAIHLGGAQKATVELNVSGNLKYNADGEKVQTAPLKVTGKLVFAERVLVETPNLRTVRYYEDAQADIRVGENSAISKLENSQRLILCEAKQGETHACSLAGPLRRQEIDLLDVPCDTLTLSKLLPEGETIEPKEGETWKLEAAGLATLMRLDAASAAEMKGVWEKIANGRAVALVEGTLQGAAGGVATDMEIKARFAYDLKLQRITSLALNWRELRAIAHAEPGFDVTASLKLTVAPLKEIPATLTDASLSGLPLDSDPTVALVRMNSPEGGFEFLHDRRWRSISDQQTLTVLRMVDRGELVAQCNITRMPDLAAAGTRITLDRFQQDVQAALKDNAAQVVDSNESTTDSGLRLLRVTVAGTISEIPILWTYCHVSDDSGQRASFVFTRESKLADRSAGTEETMISHFRFTERSKAQPGTPTPAAPKQARLNEEAVKK